jgi:hypothetical protein
VKVGGRNPQPKDEITVASASDTISLKVVQRRHAIELFKVMGYNAKISLLGDIALPLCPIPFQQAAPYVYSVDVLGELGLCFEDRVTVGASKLLFLFRHPVITTSYVVLNVYSLNVITYSPNFLGYVLDI